MSKKLNSLISEAYEFQVCAFFNKWIKSYYHIDHFAILIVLPDDNILHVSTNSLLVKHYNQMNFIQHDYAMNPAMYKNWPYYPWDCSDDIITSKAVSFRKNQWGLNAGTNFVRKIKTDQGEFFIIYAVATHRNGELAKYHFTCNANAIFEIGDFSYNNLRHIFQENTFYNLPKIETFKFFSAGISINNNGQKIPGKLINFYSDEPRHQPQLTLVK
ncbi:hypothetical protein [Facilibium subflavum]|uniref:hypothetical protein n=1 Tax=Facilibium subflavum TaxID=2219058 RepID=UPI000E64D12E|nr:hypothetical protein [Facilibium subflavum]